VTTGEAGADRAHEPQRPADLAWASPLREVPGHDTGQVPLGQQPALDHLALAAEQPALDHLALAAEHQARAELAHDLEVLPHALAEPDRLVRPGGSSGSDLGSSDTAVVAAREGAVRSVALSAVLVPWRRTAVALLLVSACIALAACQLLAIPGFHTFAVPGIVAGWGTPLGGVAGPLLLLAWQVALYPWGSRPVRGRRGASRPHTVITVPCYNEDPGILRASLESMLIQSRRPDHVYVVDDGSTATDYEAVRLEMTTRFAAAGVRLSWERTANRGKRHAQALAVEATPDADIYVTVDSDTRLSPDAIEQILLPFSDQRVQSVAGVIMSSNNRATLLVRILDLLYTTTLLLARGGLSAMGSVLVNSGGLAAYRAAVFREALPAYLNHTFFGRKVEFSDDAMLTFLATMRGRTVQQPSAIALCAMPQRLSHHRRQYLRWMRGLFIMTWWRFRYLPLRSFIYWWHLFQWVMFVTASWLTGEAIVAEVRQGGSPGWLLGAALLTYASTLPYLTIRRNDERFSARLVTWLLAPVALLWNFTALCGFRWWAMATCLKSGWGTRQKVEVTL
jgi:hyaluronan synthase